VRGVYAYHTKSRGWSDIGYNFLVDRFGTIYEGRHGGIDRAVIGARALGFNTGGIGVAAMGNHDGLALSKAARGAVTRLLAWKFAVHRIDPGGKASIASTCTGACKHPQGRAVRLPTLFGHRDVGYTSCPGTDGHATLPALRSAIAARKVELSTPPFSDDDRSAHAAAIGDLHRRGIVKGCTSTTFCPKASVRRDQMASFVTRTMAHVRRPVPRSDRDWFTDDGGTLHEGAINALADASLTLGCTQDSYCAGDTTSRGQMASFLSRAINAVSQ
jgi:uncharacterized protein with LGFP repeats